MAKKRGKTRALEPVAVVTRGVGQPRKYGRQIVATRGYSLPPDLHDWIAAQAAAAGLSRSAWLARELMRLRDA